MLIKINFEILYFSKSIVKYVEYIKLYFVIFKIIIYGFLWFFELIINVCF